MNDESIPLVLVGYPFVAYARGWTTISFFRSFQTINQKAFVCDVFSHQEKKRPMDIAIESELEGVLVSRPGSGINIYHLNGDEIDISLARLQHRLPDGAYNIVYPFWELSKYPAPWAEKLKLFDEIWAPSQFIHNALEKSVKKPIVHMPLPVELKFSTFMGRQDFGFPESSFLFLSFLDFRSYVDRKNPFASIEVFEKICESKPFADVQLVLKFHGGKDSSNAQAGCQRFLERIHQSPFANQIILVDRILSENEVKNLIRCCDCFISLHRSEGFGLVMAEAMYLAKPVIATAYSSNIDFMDEQTAYMVNYKLIPVGVEQYPYADGQVWADPDVEKAAEFALKLLDNPASGRGIEQRASQRIRTHFSYLAMGLRYKQRIDTIISKKGMAP